MKVEMNVKKLAAVLAVVASVAAFVTTLVSCGPGSDKAVVSRTSSSPTAVTTAAHADPSASSTDGSVPAAAGTDAVAATTDASGATTDASGATTDASGATTDASGATAATTSPEAEAAAAAAALKKKSVSDPTFSIAAGAYAGSISVAISCAVPEAKIRYTLDGSAPSPTKGRDYTGPVTVDKTAKLQAIAYIPDGKSSAAVARVYTIGELYVQAGGKGDGRIDGALGSVGKAVAEAARTGIKVVKIAAGTYAESVRVSSSVELSGGWTDGFAKRGGVSVIAAPSDLDSTQTSPSAAALFSGSACDGKVVGLKFTGSDVGYCAGVVVADGAAPVFSSCVFVGGSGSYSYGIKATGNASPRISYCTIDGGTGSTSYGVSADSARVSVHASTLQAGAGTVASYAATFTNAKASVTSSALFGGRGGTTYGIAFYQCPEASVLGNTILGGAGKTGYGVFIAYTSPVIVGNLIGQASFGIYENYGDSSPKRVEGNCLFSCSEALYSDSESKARVNYGATDASGNFVSAGGALSSPFAKGNLVATPVLGPAPYYKTQASSPAEILSGGVALPGVDTDIAGEKRVAPYSIGAWQISM